MNNSTELSLIGYITVFIAGIGFGTNYVPVKTVETGDGIIFQWIMSAAIIIGGFVVNSLTHFSKVYPLSIIGGVMWECGNVLVVFIFKTVGMGLGSMLWMSTALVFGWSVGKFGMFGLNKDYLKDVGMNYAGVAMIIASIIGFSLLKSEVRKINDYTKINNNEEPNKFQSLTGEHDWLDEKLQQIDNFKTKIIGIALSIFSGVCYGLMFVPINYVIKFEDGAPTQVVNYVFGFSIGVFLTSTLFMLIYCIILRNRPYVNPQSIFPGIICGAIWITGFSNWCISNNLLGQAITYPLASGTPMLISCLISMFAFKEIRGKRNFIILGIFFPILILGILLTSFSKGI